MHIGPTAWMKSSHDDSSPLCGVSKSQSSELCSSAMNPSSVHAVKYTTLLIAGPYTDGRAGSVLL